MMPSSVESPSIDDPIRSRSSPSWPECDNDEDEEEDDDTVVDPDGECSSSRNWWRRPGARPAAPPPRLRPDRCPPSVAWVGPVASGTHDQHVCWKTD